MTKINTNAFSESIDEVPGNDYAKNFAKRMLKTQLFIGTFQEKRFVEDLDSYRDVIRISPKERDFIKNLLVVKKKIEESFLKRPWIGITEPNTVGAPVGYCLWVTLREEVFGRYWYKVKTIQFLNNEIRLELDIVRPVDNSSSSSVNDETGRIDINFFISNFTEWLKFNLIYFCTNILTFKNLKQSVIFIFVLVGTMITLFVSTVKYLMEYFLKLLRETSRFVNACTPIIMSFLNLIGKTIYGFYSLIYALWRSKSHEPAPVYNSYYTVDPRMIQYRDPNQRFNRYFNDRAIQYPSQRSSVRIEPLD